jgi:hypothetical protein
MDNRTSLWFTNGLALVHECQWCHHPSEGDLYQELPHNWVSVQCSALRRVNAATGKASGRVRPRSSVSAD